MDFAVAVDHRVKIKENEKRNKHLDFARERKKLRNMKVTVVPIVISALGTIPKGLERGAGRVGNCRANQTHSNHSIIAVDQNTETIPGDLETSDTSK